MNALSHSFKENNIHGDTYPLFRHDNSIVKYIFLNAKLNN